MKVDNSEGPALVFIQAGCFSKGSLETEVGHNGGEELHRVCIEKDFALGQYEVTFAEYDRFCEATNREKPSDKGWGRDQRPVINVSWQDAVAYAEWLTQQTGQTYRLPTEVEWEYAARAGTATPFWTGSCVTTDQANYDGTYGYGELDCGAKTGVYRGKTLPVGSFASNLWKIYDTMGNVWEWTCSPIRGYDGGERSCVSNSYAYPVAFRGGSWFTKPAEVRSANRSYQIPAYHDNYLGFRLARSL